MTEAVVRLSRALRTHPLSLIRNLHTEMEAKYAAEQQGGAVGSSPGS